MVDQAGNVSEEAAVTDTTITYSDTAGPTLSSFATSSSSVQLTTGYYDQDDTINISAVLSEDVVSTGSMTVLLNTNDSITLTNSGSNSLSGTYQVSLDDNVSQLAIKEITSSNITDIYGNSLASGVVQQSTNIQETAVIDTEEIEGVIGTLSGATLTLQFSEAVYNQSVVNDVISGLETVNSDSFASWNGSIGTFTLQSDNNIQSGFDLTFEDLFDLAGNVSDVTFEIL
ncbi:MAG: Uncharacterised protein [Halieaceae bacterium]|nr:MAG: Uncharacterised protein [Halieaceae bacterium]